MSLQQRSSRLLLPLASLVCSTLYTASAEADTLKNDSYISGGVFGAVTVPQGAAFGVKLTALPRLYPLRLDAVEVLVGGTGSHLFTVNIYQDNGTSATPGPAIYTSGFTTYLLAATNDFNVIDLTTANITIASGSFRIVLGEAASSDPTTFFGRDTDGLMPQRNTRRVAPAFTWQFYESVGGTGDLIMRARITQIPEPTAAAFWCVAGAVVMARRSPARQRLALHTPSTGCA